MSIECASDRLYQTGWQPDDNEVEFAPDGTPLPSVNAVRRAFGRAGLTLQMKHTLMFGCHTATWGDGTCGDACTAIGATELEAAVMALAQLREAERFPRDVVEPKATRPSREAITL